MGLSPDRDPSKLHRVAVGVMGSAGGDIAPGVMDKVYQLGQEIARRNWVLVTGACPGLPHQAVRGANAEGGTVVGISPALNFGEHMLKYRSPCRGYDVIIYTGSGLMGREIENIRTCDMVILAGGRSGTLGEFAIAYDEAKIIGALTGTGGITENLRQIISFIHKDTGARVVYADDPLELMDGLASIYETELLPYYRTVLANSDPDGILES
ncbi:MAG: hypothetical protein O7C74_02395 [Acidobacteria bacterium]|nr:hypothetical protein [Acidobacteriota bacterium]MCZ6746048.1 hypothetical protein [Acidobacteriota bacterium]